MKSFRKILDRVINNIFLAYIVTVIIIFFISIPTSPFDEAICGSFFFGILALPTITQIVLGILDVLISDD